MKDGINSIDAVLEKDVSPILFLRSLALGGNETLSSDSDLLKLLDNRPSPGMCNILTAAFPKLQKWVKAEFRRTEW